MTTPRAMLKWVSGAVPVSGPRFTLAGQPCVLGRSEHGDLVVPDHEVSNVHAEIRWEADAYVIRDLGSSNGTWVNDQRVQRASLTPGDVVRVGRTLMEYVPMWTRTSAPGGLAPPVPVRDSMGFVRSRTRFSTQPSELQAGDPSLSFQAYERLSAAFQAVQNLFVCETIEELCEQILDAAFELVRAETGYVLLTDENGDLQLRSERHEGERAEIGLSRTVIDAARAGESILAQDAASDDRWSGVSSVQVSGTRSLMCVPLNHSDHVLGVVYLTNEHEDAFEERDLQLITGIGAGAGIALANLKLRRQWLDRERLASMGLAVSNAAHHLKNIILSIKGPITLMDKGFTDDRPDVVERAFPILQRGADRMEEAVRAMLAYGKAGDPELSSGSLNDLVDEVAQSVAARAAHAGVALDVDLDRDLGESLLDSGRLHDAVLNLVGNAIEAHGKAGGEARVHISTQRDPESGRVSVSVSDNGPGMTAEVIGRIFEPFFSTKGSEGTGLGLATVKKIIEEAGGRVEVSSKLGEGSTFRLVLPKRPGYENVDAEATVDSGLRDTLTVDVLDDEESGEAQGG